MKKKIQIMANDYNKLKTFSFFSSHRDFLKGKGRK